jgi:hypothetical protein
MRKKRKPNSRSGKPTALHKPIPKRGRALDVKRPVPAEQAAPPDVLVDIIVRQLLHELQRLLSACGYDGKEFFRIEPLKDAQAPLFPFKGNLAFGSVPAGRILQLWFCEPRFLDGSGSPLPLPVSGANSFETLLELADCEVEPLAVRKTLLEAKFVRMDGKRIVPRTRAALSSEGGKVTQVLLCLGDLVRTLEHNLTEGRDPAKALFQRFASDTAVPEARVDEFKAYFDKQAMSLLFKAEEWLFRAEQEAPSSANMRRVNVHVFLSPFEAKTTRISTEIDAVLEPK